MIQGFELLDIWGLGSRVPIRVTIRAMGVQDFGAQGLYSSKGFEACMWQKNAENPAQR